MASHYGVDDGYWLRRSNMMYYKYIDVLVKAFAYEAKSIIDVGSANTEYIESFTWIPEKYTLDKSNPYSSQTITAIEADFLTYTPDKKFDFATCLQVLEHVPEAGRFARKLFDVAERVLISVPYKWPETAEDEHLNDPVDEKKLKDWTGRDPDYSIIVAEPLRIPEKGISQRLICYYGSNNEKINYKKVNQHVKELNRKEDEGRRKLQLEKLSDEIEANNQMYKDIQEDLKKIREEQKRYYQLNKLEQENMSLSRTAIDKAESNQAAEMRIESLKKQINSFENKIQREAKESRYYIKEYNKRTSSTSWKVTSPIRLAGSVVKKITKRS